MGEYSRSQLVEQVDKLYNQLDVELAKKPGKRKFRSYSALKKENIIDILRRGKLSCRNTKNIGKKQENEELHDKITKIIQHSIAADLRIIHKKIPLTMANIREKYPYLSAAIENNFPLENGVPRLKSAIEFAGISYNYNTRQKYSFGCILDWVSKQKLEDLTYIKLNNQLNQNNHLFSLSTIYHHNSMKMSIGKWVISSGRDYLRLRPGGAKTGCYFSEGELKKIKNDKSLSSKDKTRIISNILKLQYYPSDGYDSRIIRRDNVSIDGYSTITETSFSVITMKLGQITDESAYWPNKYCISLSYNNVSINFFISEDMENKEVGSSPYTDALGFYVTLTNILDLQK